MGVSYSPHHMCVLTEEYLKIISADSRHVIIECHFKKPVQGSVWPVAVQHDYLLCSFCDFQRRQHVASPYEISWIFFHCNILRCSVTHAWFLIGCPANHFFLFRFKLKHTVTPSCFGYVLFCFMKKKNFVSEKSKSKKGKNKDQQGKKRQITA